MVLVVFKLSTYTLTSSTNPLYYLKSFCLHFLNFSVKKGKEQEKLDITTAPIKSSLLYSA